MVPSHIICTNSDDTEQNNEPNTGRTSLLSVVKWANKLSEPQYLLGPTG